MLKDNEAVKMNKNKILNKAEEKTSSILKKALKYSIENVKARKNSIGNGKK